MIRSAFIMALAAGAAALATAGGAQAQGYGYGDESAPPAPPYVYRGGDAPYGYGVSDRACGGDGFTLLGAHAGVTVLGFRLGGGASFDAPTGCGGGEDAYRGGGEDGGWEGGGGVAYSPRPYAPEGGYDLPPPPYAEAPQYPPQYEQPYAQPYGYPGGYGEERPCGCEAGGW